MALGEKERRLLEAAAAGNSAHVRRLVLEQGADIDVTDERGLTPLMLATNNKHKETATAILVLKRRLYYMKKAKDAESRNSIARAIKRYRDKGAA